VVRKPILAILETLRSPILTRPSLNMKMFAHFSGPEYLEVAVYDAVLVEYGEAVEYLKEDGPDLIFLDVADLFFGELDLAEEVSLVCQLHHDACHAEATTGSSTPPR
jgi:CheY-like chemotaxis protein